MSKSPDNENVVTHYACIVYKANLDGTGYAFPYDDIEQSNGTNQSRSIGDGSPGLFTIAIEEIDGLVS
jgi:hypothetical protein